MGSIFKPKFTKDLPEGAELFSRKGKQYARWTDQRGRSRTAPVVVPSEGKYAGQTRILLESTRYFARYRDSKGVHVVSTECRDETAAMGFLRELERRVELVRGNLLTHSEAEASDHQTTLLADHVREYDESLRVHINRKSGFAACDKHRRLRRDHLNRVAKDTGWTKLADPHAARCPRRHRQALCRRGPDRSPRCPGSTAVVTTDSERHGARDVGGDRDRWPGHPRGSCRQRLYWCLLRD